MISISIRNRDRNACERFGGDWVHGFGMTWHHGVHDDHRERVQIVVCRGSAVRVDEPEPEE